MLSLNTILKFCVALQYKFSEQTCPPCFQPNQWRSILHAVYAEESYTARKQGIPLINAHDNVALALVCIWEGTAKGADFFCIE